MKQFYFTSILLLSFTSAFSQAPFWTETFGTGCNTGQVADGFNPTGLGTWSAAITGTQGILPNVWYISAEEGGMPVGSCGANCAGSGNNRTLHVSSAFGDLGAAYAAGAGAETDVRIQSPVINCTGQNTISLVFKYLEKGVPGVDFFDLQYSANGGATWSVIATPAAVPLGTCAPQGKWASYTISLPASANNNNNVKIGFRWTNTDATGADPSVAIDDVTLSGTAAPAFTASFTLVNPLCSGKSTTVTANTGSIAATGYTWTSNPVGPTFGTPNASVTTITFPASGTFSITLAAANGTTIANNTQTILVNPTPNLTLAASPATIISGASSTLTANGATNYTWNPGALTGSNVVVSPTVTTSYTVTGLTGACSNTSIVTVTVSSTSTTGINSYAANNNNYIVFPNPTSDKLFIQTKNTVASEVAIEIVDALGKTVLKQTQIFTASENTRSINVSSINAGIYFIKITSAKDNKVIRFIKD